MAKTKRRSIMATQKQGMQPKKQDPKPHEGQRDMNQPGQQRQDPGQNPMRNKEHSEGSKNPQQQEEHKQRSSGQENQSG